jgi:hypothetical protein
VQAEVVRARRVENEVVLGAVPARDPRRATEGVVFGARDDLLDAVREAVCLVAVIDLVGVGIDDRRAR